MIRISFIIVSFNNEDEIRRCIGSLLKYKSSEDEIIVFDNASSDNTLKELDEFKDEVKIIKSDVNLGFSKANNKASEEAVGKYLFLLNPDTEVLESFDKLVDFYNQNDVCGILAPKLLMKDHRTQASVKNLPTIKGAFLEFILNVKNAYSEYVPAGDQPKVVEAVYGAAMLIKKDLFKKIGGFDERYFIYYEDMDLCKKINKLGKKIYYFPGVSIRHLVGASKSEIDRYKLNLESARIYHGILGSFLLSLIFLIPRLRRRLKLL